MAIKKLYYTEEGFYYAAYNKNGIIKEITGKEFGADRMKNHKGVLYREWKACAPRAAILLVHGLGAHSGRWSLLAEFFLRNNISSYAIELKGFGETKDLKGHVDSLDTYFSDIRIFRNLIAQENPGKKIFILGESMGGLIAFLMAGHKERLFDGLICVSPAFKSRIKFSLIEYIKIISSFIYNPKKQFRVNFDSSMCTRDSEYLKILNSDSGEHRLATSKLLLNLVFAQIKAAGLKDKINSPVLFLLAGYDKLVDLESSEKIFDNLSLKDKTIIIYPAMYHALSIDIGREKVFSDMLKWIERLL